MASYPEQGELVIATVSNVHYHSIFCNLDEYGVSGMIHISEVAPGRIRNLSDYVKEGKVVIAKVLRVDENKGHVDLSIRRVTEAQRKQKAASRKQEALVENILTQVAKTTKASEQELKDALKKSYPNQELYDVFVEVVEEGHQLQTDLDKSVQEALSQAITDRISPKRVEIKGELTIKTYVPDGVNQISDALTSADKTIHISYAGSGRYTVIVEAKEYKKAENTLSSFIEETKQSLQEAEVSFERTDK